MLALTPGAVFGVIAGARVMVKVPALQLRLMFGAFLFFVAFRQLVWHFSAGAPQDGAEGLLIEVAFGFAGGVLAGVLGVGGGAIFVPAIVIFGLAHTGAGEDPQKVAQGVSLVVIVATGAVGTMTNLRQETIDAGTVLWVMPAAVVAAFGASILANRLDVEVLKTIFGLTALFLGCQTVYTTHAGAAHAPISAEGVSMDATEKRRALAQIAKAIAVCTDCGLCRGRTHAVPGEGNPDADDHVHRRGAGVLRGPAGRARSSAPPASSSTNCSASIGLDRKKVFIAQRREVPARRTTATRSRTRSRPAASTSTRRSRPSRRR